MTVKEVVENEKRSAHGPVNLLASRRLPDDILIVVTESVTDNSDLLPHRKGELHREVRVIVCQGRNTLGSFIAKQEYI